MTGALLTIATIGYDFNRRASSLSSGVDRCQWYGRDRTPTTEDDTGSAVWQRCLFACSW